MKKSMCSPDQTKGIIWRGYGEEWQIPQMGLLRRKAFRRDEVAKDDLAAQWEGGYTPARHVNGSEANGVTEERADIGGHL